MLRTSYSRLYNLYCCNSPGKKTGTKCTLLSVQTLRTLLFIFAVQLGKTNGCKSLNSSRYIGCVSGLFGNVYSVGECLAGAHTTYIDLFQMEIVKNSYIFHKSGFEIGLYVCS